MKPSSPFVTERARIKGLGSAKSGTKHFLHERISGVALIPLTFLFVITLLTLSGADYARAVATLKNPFFGLTVLAFLIAGAYHMKLGMQVIIEDYAHGGAKMVLLFVNTFFTVAVALASALAVLKLSFGA